MTAAGPPFFSVIIPSYNRAGLLRAALKSLALQSFEDHEAFIIDDGSSDDTPAVFAEFAGRPGWHFHRMEKNRGQARCRNFALKQARGRYITFLDADDLWLPQRLERFAEAAAAHPAAGFIFSNGYILQFDRISGVFFAQDRSIPTGKLPPYMALSDRWLPYVTTNVALRREAVDKAGFFREDMSHLEDMELYVRVLRDFETACIAEPLSVYRIHALTKDPKSLTLQWDKGIEDFLTALATARPPADIEALLKRYVFSNQSSIYLKNLNAAKARHYLKLIPAWSARMHSLYLLTFTPKALLFLLKRVYKFYRIMKLFFAPEASFGEVERWMQSSGLR